jgi:S-(hydroxymethyl)glutathione dehydrogenase/alcohol dehydrogenase
MGSNQFPSDIGNFVAMYRSGILDLDNMITDVVDFDDINAGFRRLGSGKALRIVAKIAPE